MSELVVFVAYSNSYKQAEQESEFKIFAKTGSGAGVKLVGIGVALESKKYRLRSPLLQILFYEFS